MKIICEKCHAKYSIKDEKVSGKNLKVKCKKCGEIIEVCGASVKVLNDLKKPSAKSPKAAPVSPSKALKTKPGAKPGVKPEAKPSSNSFLENRFADSFKKKDDSSKNYQGTPGLHNTLKKSVSSIEKKQEELPLWYAAVDNKPIGPISAKKIHLFRSQGKVTDDSLIWKDGMLDWDVLRNCKELVGLLAKLDLASSAALEKLSKPKQQAPRAGLFSETPAPNQSPLKGASVGSFGFEPEAAVTDKHKQPEIAFSSNADSLDDWAQEYGNSDVSTVTSIFPPSPKGSGKSWKMIIAIGFFVICAFVFTYVILTGQNTPETIITEKIIEKTEIIYRDRPIPVDNSTVDSKKEEPSKAQNADSKTTTPRRATTTTSAPSAPKEETAEERKQRLLSQMSSPVPGGNLDLSVGQGGAGSSASGAGLSQKQMESVVSKNRASLQQCYERVLKKGTVPMDRDLRVDFNMSIGRSGTVTTIDIKGTGASYAELKTCLENAAKRWMFPNSSATSQLQFPILFTPAR